MLGEKDSYFYSSDSVATSLGASYLSPLSFFWRSLFDFPNCIESLTYVLQIIPSLMLLSHVIFINFRDTSMQKKKKKVYSPWPLQIEKFPNFKLQILQENNLLLK